jgi:hypothetical protein
LLLAMVISGWDAMSGEVKHKEAGWITIIAGMAASFAIGATIGSEVDNTSALWTIKKEREPKAKRR